ncbi:MAG: DNA-directed RNA polymerase subunit alpha [Parcubacteria group bacterium]|nr:DNA-directed RNA polymerase subunit alpha [Parcubacteria group bacterium]
MPIPLPEKPRMILSEGNRAIFEIDGLYPGYGMTVGNALRRVLLSSLPGAAITTVKLKGVSHEFSTVPHVLEDVVEILLNLKQVRLKLHGGEPQWISLKAKGEQDVKAGDMSAPSQVEIVNPDLHLATLTDKKAELVMDLEVQQGVGYETREERRREKVEIGTIALDAVYSPVRRVHYEVENMRVGERTDYNRLRITIETDGTVTPEEALSTSAKILVDHFTRVHEFERLPEGEAVEIREEEGTSEGAAEVSEEPSKAKIADSKLPTRIVNILTKAGVRTVAGLMRKTESQVEAIEGMGPTGVKEVKKALGKLGLGLREEAE